MSCENKECCLLNCINRNNSPLIEIKGRLKKKFGLTHSKTFNSIKYIYQEKFKKSLKQKFYIHEACLKEIKSTSCCFYDTKECKRRFCNGGFLKKKYFGSEYIKKSKKNKIICDFHSDKLKNLERNKNRKITLIENSSDFDNSDNVFEGSFGVGGFENDEPFINIRKSEMLDHFSENILDISQNTTENTIEVLTLSSDFDGSEPETLTSSDWEPPLSEKIIKNERKIQMIDTLREKSSEDEFSEEINQLDLKPKNIQSVSLLRHKLSTKFKHKKNLKLRHKIYFNYTFSENEFSKNIVLENVCSEIKCDKKINIEDRDYFKKKFPFIFDLENYKKNIQNLAIPIQFVSKKQLQINEFQEYLFHLNKKHNVTRQYERELSILLEKFFKVKLNKSSFNYKNLFFKKLSPNIIKTHESNWLIVDPTNKLIEIGTKIPYISIFFWLNLILESDLKNKILRKKPNYSNTSVYEKNFKPSSIFDVESIKNKEIICKEDETPFILSIYIDDQAYDSSRKKSVKAVYLVVENFETSSRLKDKTIFLLMNIPKDVPVYNLTAPLPFVKELFQLSKMKCLYKHKIKVIFHQIIGDSVEQQKAAGKLSSSGTEMCRSCSLNKKDIFFNLGQKLSLETPNSNIYNISNSDSLPNSKSTFNLDQKNPLSNSKVNSKTEPNSKLNNPSIFTSKFDPKPLNTNFFDHEIKVPSRDPIQIKVIQKEYILNFFQSKDYQKTIKKFEGTKKSSGVLFQTCNFWLHFFEFDSADFSRFSICWAHLLLEGLFKDGLVSIKQRLSSKISKISKKLNYLNSYLKFINIPLNPLNKPNDLTAIECLELSMILGLCIEKKKENLIIFEWLDLFNSIVSNLYLPSRCENDELELEDFCNRFRIKHIELIDYFLLKPQLYKKDHDENIKQIRDIRNNRIKNISMKYYIEKKETEIKKFNKSKREEQKFKRFRRVNKKLIICKKKIHTSEIEKNYINTLNHFKKNLKNNINSINNSIQQKNKNKLINILKHPNLHYLRHLPESVRRNGSLFTFFLALERYHQHFKIKKYQIKKKGFTLLKFFIEREIFRKINDNSEKAFNLEKKNKYNFKISKELFSIFSFFDFNFHDLVGLKEITFNSHIFKVGNFVYTFNNEFIFIREILQNSLKDQFLLVQKIKFNTQEDCFYFENPREFHLVSPDDFRNIINFIPYPESGYFGNKLDHWEEKNSNSDEKMEIEKEPVLETENLSTNNQDKSHLFEIEIEAEEINEHVQTIHIIELQNQKDPHNFEIFINFNKKSLDYL
ncbi:hypothetical protein M0813_22242 [Anaeramoeba flamelloides]|uniref:Uncharacterized protein n=1 Tax=Anaeramoeba flamelloides TaxID=1746091 RepID=A0ABQ8YGS3_9EUKA|nr:hypothetical protein M0813_22242 [Anaeramoeba flamelloides]